MQVSVVRAQVAQLSLLLLSQLTRASVPITLLVLQSNGNEVDCASRSGQADEADRDGVSLSVEGLCVGWEEREGSNDTTNVTESHLPGRTNGATMVTTQVHVEPTDDDRHRRVTAHGNEEKSHVLDSGLIGDVQEDTETSQRKTDRDKRKDESVCEAIREPGDDHGERKGASPRRNRAELRLNWRNLLTAQVGNDGWSEVGVAVGWDDEAEVHETSEPDLVVLEAASDVAESDLALDGGLALVDLEAGCNVGALGVGQPFGVLWERREEEEEENCDEDGEET